MNITYDEMKIPTKTIKTTYKGIQDLRRPNNKRPLFIKQELVVGAIETEDNSFTIVSVTLEIPPI